ncbi:MAG: cation diffusion facilitator family transporter, partial [Tannerellaceae bacterium]
MAHNHGHNHTHSHSEKNILFAFFLNLFFAIIEVLGGIYTNSVAIISDAVHDFGDSISLGITWFLEKKSKQKSDNRFTYGYRRFSLLGAIFISFVLMISTFFVIRESIERIISPEPANAKGMFLFAIFGLIVNGAA